VPDQAAESIEGSGCGHQLEFYMMGESEFAVKVDAYASYDIFRPTLHAWCDDRAVGEIDVCCVGLSVIAGMMKV
jgi:hypothetical protein